MLEEWGLTINIEDIEDLLQSTFETLHLDLTQCYFLQLWFQYASEIIECKSFILIIK
jgi:hypothetical protein